MKLPNHAVKYTLAVLLLATLTTTQILSTSYAKYITVSDPVSDSARVAKYDVVVTEDQGNSTMGNITGSGLDGKDVNLDAAGDKNISGGTITNKTASVTKTYTVTNHSEVAVNLWRLYVRAQNESTLLIPGLTVTFAVGDAMYNTYTKNGNSTTGSLMYTTEITESTNVTGNTDFSGVALAPGESRTFTITFTLTNTDDVTSNLTGVPFDVRVGHVQID